MPASGARTVIINSLQVHSNNLAPATEGVFLPRPFCHACATGGSAVEEEGTAFAACGSANSTVI
jgi:hypothetical protein